MHPSAECNIKYRMTIAGCIPGSHLIYRHLLCYRYISYQRLSVPCMPFLSQIVMHPSAECNIKYRMTVAGCIPESDLIYRHLSCSCYYPYQCLSVPYMFLLSQLVMHLSAECNIKYRMTIAGCIPESDLIYRHLSSCRSNRDQCLSVPYMSLLSQLAMHLSAESNPQD